MGRIAMLGAGLLLLTSVMTTSAPAAGPDVVHFTAAGDYNANANTSAVLNGINAADPDLNLALGDLSYGTTGAEQAWCDFVTSRVGAGFAFELISGNHESNGQNGNINDFSACLPNQLPGAAGTYGRQYYVDVPAVNPVARYIFISPNLAFPEGTWNYNVGTARYNWTAAAIDSARTASIPWVIVAMHKPCLSLGEYACEPGADITNLLVSKKVDLVLTGHEHLYQRTKQLAFGAGCTSLTIGSYNSACVRDSGSTMSAGAGTVFATVGTGGTALRDVNLSDPEASYFNAVSGNNVNPTYGFLDVTANLDSLTARFLGQAGGTFTDLFTLDKGAPPPNQPPTASFTSAPSGLAAAFNASASNDLDGTITGYAWAFGDATTASGVTTNHTYASAGTYNVTLTVTDDDGDTGTATNPVTVTSTPTPTVIASDNFERTLSSGWGTAPTGGAWTASGGAASGVGAGTGRLTMASPGTGPSAYLGSLSSTDTDVTIEVSLDKVPVGGTTGVVESLLLRRVAGAGDYEAKVGIMPGGGVKISLSRTSSTGTETALAGPVVISGLTYTANTSLTIRGQATGTSPTTLRAKIWRTGQAEPGSWTVTATNSQAELQAGGGGVGVKSYLSGSATNAPIISRFDNLVAYVASTLP